MNTKYETEEGVTYSVTEPTEKAEALMKSIGITMETYCVQPDEVLPVLGEAVIRFLTVMANVIECDPLELVKSFGEGIYKAELEFYKNEDEDEVQTVN